MQFGKSKKKGHSTLYLHLTPEGIYALALGQKNIIEQLAGEDTPTLFAHLKVFVSTHNLQNCEAKLILSRSDYQLLYVDAPHVPDAEQAQAAKFLVKDLINYPLAEAAVDVFEMPNIGQQQKIFIVTSHKSLITEIQEACVNMDLNLTSITIPEIALNNSLSKLNNETQVSGLIFKGSENAHLMISKENDIEMIRDIGPIENLEDPAKLEEIALEIQRSLDFYQTALQGTPPGILYLDWAITDAKFKTAFESKLTQKIEALPRPVDIKIEGDLTHALIPFSLSEENI